MDMDVRLLKDLVFDLESSGVGPDVIQRDRCALLHHIAKLPGQYQLALSFEFIDFDLQDIAAK